MSKIYDRDPVVITIIDRPETLLLSWGRDAVSFGGLIGTAYALNVFMPPSGWLNSALGIAWILWMFSKSSQIAKRMTVAEAQAYLAERAKGGEA